MCAKAKPKKTRKAQRDPSEGLKATWLEIYKQEKPLVVMMAIVLVLSAVLFVLSLTALRPQNTVVIVGYGDVYGEIAGISGGYRRESWLNMLAYPILAILFGVVHNLSVLRVYRRYGRVAAMLVAAMTMMLIIGAGIVLLRLIGEW